MRANESEIALCRMLREKTKSPLQADFLSQHGISIPSFQANKSDVFSSPLPALPSIFSLKAHKLYGIITGQIRVHCPGSVENGILASML
jgi:hypothetical protein